MKNTGPKHAESPPYPRCIRHSSADIFTARVSAPGRHDRYSVFSFTLPKRTAPS